MRGKFNGLLHGLKKFLTEQYFTVSKWLSIPYKEKKPIQHVSETIKIINITLELAWVTESNSVENISKCYNRL